MASPRPAPIRDQPDGLAGGGRGLRDLPRAGGTRARPRTRAVRATSSTTSATVASNPSSCGCSRPTRAPAGSTRRPASSSTARANPSTSARPPSPRSATDSADRPGVGRPRDRGVASGGSDPPNPAEPPRRSPRDWPCGAHSERRYRPGPGPPARADRVRATAMMGGRASPWVAPSHVPESESPCASSPTPAAPSTNACSGRATPGSCTAWRRSCPARACSSWTPGAVVIAPASELTELVATRSLARRAAPNSGSSPWTPSCRRRTAT